MRQEFRKELKILQDNLRMEANAAAQAMRRASRSLKDANLALAESVIDADSTIDSLERYVDELGISLLARQAPVASDLRVVVSSLRVSSILERMGDLARHVAYIARGRFPERAAEGPAHKLLVAMAEEAAEMGNLVARLIETKNLDFVHEIMRRDEILDDLHRNSFELVLDDSTPLTRQEVVDVVMIARFLERFGDHAVGVGRRMTFLVTGYTPDYESVPGTEEEMLG